MPDEARIAALPRRTLVMNDGAELSIIDVGSGPPLISPMQRLAREQPARQIVGRVEVRPNNQHLFSWRASLKPGAGMRNAAVAHMEGEKVNVPYHAETLRPADLDHNQIGEHLHPLLLAGLPAHSR
jgi:hypothetical protein